MESKIAKLVSVAAVSAICSAAIHTSAFARSQTCHRTTSGEIEALFDRWNQSLKTGNPDDVVENYAPDSVLLPTVSNKPRLTPEEKKDYFAHFLENHPAGKIDFRKVMVDCNTAIDTGLYTFTFGDGSKVNARYTFTYRWDGKQWLITTHHSSKMPEPD